MVFKLLPALAMAAIVIVCGTWAGAADKPAGADKPAAGDKIWEAVPNPPEVTKPRWIEADKAGNLYVADHDKGFHMSKDSGKTWTPINGTEPDNLVHGFTNRADPKTGTLYAGWFKDKTGAYSCSTDQGKTWSPVKGSTNCANDGVCFLPNGDILFGGFWGPGTFVSTDGGKTCTLVKLDKADFNGAAFAIGYNPVTKECWLGAEKTGKAVFRSTDLGRSWTLVPTPTERPVLCDAMHVAFNDAGDVLFQTMGAVYRTKDKGATWEAVYDSGTGAGSAGALRRDPNGVLYAGNYSSPRNPPIARSTKNGDKDTWVDFSSGIPPKQHATCIVFNPGDGRMYCVCKDDEAKPKTAGIFRTIEPVAAAATRPAPEVKAK